MKHPRGLTQALLLLTLATAALVGATAAFAVDQTPKNGCFSRDVYQGSLTSPPFSTGSAGAQVSFFGWFEIESIDPTGPPDLVIVEYGLPDGLGGTNWSELAKLNPANPAPGQADVGYSNNGLNVPPSFQSVGPLTLPVGALSQSVVNIRFRFDTGDTAFQGFRGVGIDEVSIDTGSGGSTVPTQEFEEPFGVGANDWTADASAGAGAPFWHIVDDSQNLSVKSPQINPDLVTLADSGALPTASGGTHQAWFGDDASGTFCGPDFANRFVAPPLPPLPPPLPPPPPPKKLTLADLPAPVLGKTANVEPVKGTVRVGIKTGAASVAARGRASQKGLTFVPLQEARQVPLGSFLDTRKGTVALQSSTASAGKTYLGNFSAGLFQVLQSRKKKAKGLTNLVLKGGRYSSCKATKTQTGKGAHAALSRKALRRLRAKAKGRFRTRGRYSAATVRGTKWAVTDRCDGTLTKVTRGKVAVRDFRRKKTIVLTKGKSYLAKAKR
jgi:hypothetical protein